MKLDLVTWTYNSGETLQKSLPTISQGIPEDDICHRIAIDGGSRDNTRALLEQHGWRVIEAPKRGIPYQANLALSMVDTEFFASFEHDIILNPKWYAGMVSNFARYQEVGAAQGVRLYVGSKTMQAIEEWQYKAGLIPPWVYSIDNALYRTAAVKQAGGFSDECMASADGLLRGNMFRHGYKWITDTAIVSGHYRKDFREQFKHQMKSLELARYFWSSNPETISSQRRVLSMLGGNPKHVIDMAGKSRMLRVPVAWYILRLQKGMYFMIPHEEKSVKPVSMDRWYLTKFQAAVRASRQILSNSDSLEIEPGAGLRCQLCGQNAQLAFLVPREWVNILPIFERHVSKILYACSDAHADDISERIFKKAFDYVAPGN